MDKPDVLKVKKLFVDFPGINKRFEVVRGIDINLAAGTTMGIVGESGSGKSMTAMALMGLLPFTARMQGEIWLNNSSLHEMSDDDYEKIRGSKLSIVFQDPSSSLNPVMTIGEQLVETIMKHQKIDANEAEEKAVLQLKKMDITDSDRRMKNYPHQLSGGMKQRVLIAMALLCDPDCLILDEPTTALDVTVQSQILDLIENIQQQSETSIILISHDLGIVSEVADEVAIMYAGKFVEKGKVGDILTSPMHPYTIGLMESIPAKRNYKTRLKTIGGIPPRMDDLPSGCSFHPRCDRCAEKCIKTEPGLMQAGSQWAACWNIEVNGI